ncbi:Protein of unknown function DUF3592 [Gemmatirosa kalamazoonensis]|uniref:DUF3592 domain-containing protein n=1 Tax=Gemmatirosa kalamazoonensis TaxID=861299 RepID=W0RHS6_9BACT|nr:DUF3592 domain-containing protein [Gemmatirosa kalamazoonensis]AHG88958.1 Protein of unknown function DUF3592 [Gemmatirosa kalamazoonensis]
MSGAIRLTGLALLAARLGFSAAFGLMGLYLLSVERWLFARRLAFVRRGVVVDGRIVGFKTKTSTSTNLGGPLFAPVVEFITHDGQPVRVASSTYNRPNPYSIGQTVRVRYVPGDARSAELDAEARGWWVIVVVGVLLLTALVVASLPWLLGPPTS